MQSTFSNHLQQVERETQSSSPSGLGSDGSDPSTRSRRSKKTRTGCDVCKRRKLKCDEALPGCRRCFKFGIECPGYSRSVKWSTKHERNLKLPSSPGPTWFEKEAEGLSRSIAQGSLPQAQPGHHEGDLPGFSPDVSDLNFESDWPSFSPRGLDDTQAALDATTFNSIDRDSDQPESEICHQKSMFMDLNDNEKQLLNLRVSSSNSELSLYVPAGEDSILLSHYFSFVCEVASSFDSSVNPFRSRVTKMMDASPLLFTCVMSISAAHLYQNQGESSSIPLSFQTEAISKISEELAKISTHAPPHPPGILALAKPSAASLVKDDILLGIILLGMTSSWHDPSSLGLYHLTGSRHLFKLWMATNGLEEPLGALSMTQNFIVSSMVYWEVMVSFLLDQDLEAISYLDVFLDPAPESLSQPCPWTGVATDIFIRLAKVGTMARKRRSLHSRRLTGSEASTLTQLIEEASTLEQAILKSRAPLIGLVKDTGDPRSPPSHLVKMARSYRLASLLELYRAFPEIATSSTSRFDEVEEVDKQSQLVIGLAFDILEILETIPDNSRTIAIQSLVYLIAGSTLGHLGAMKGHKLTATQSRQNQLIKNWRQFVRNRFYKSFLSIGLHTINRVGTILEEVWSRMDSVVSSAGQGHVMDVHWIDVMTGKKLETILG
ncbi:hypothetical protein NCS52_00939300 [Fusarium sp. LHS14.1]|nr:hypothetical protein NCS52_00939300 [Fusarium sp. LHS14.1]